jgi:hypothetical protein
MKTHSLRIATSAIALMLVVASASVAGHHGTNISYDRSKQFTTQAIVKSFEYRNPHPELHVELKDDKGTTHQWALELLPNPAALIRNGWSRANANEALKPGTLVMVTIAPSRAGGVVGLLLRVASMDGKELVTGGGGPGGRQADPDAAKPEAAGRGAN